MRYNDFEEAVEEQGTVPNETNDTNYTSTNHEECGSEAEKNEENSTTTNMNNSTTTTKKNNTMVIVALFSDLSEMDEELETIEPNRREDEVKENIFENSKDDGTVLSVAAPNDSNSKDEMMLSVVLIMLSFLVKSTRNPPERQ